MKEGKDESLKSKFEVMLKESVLSLDEALELAKMATDSVDVKFKDIMIGEKLMRVEGDELEVGSAVVWVSEDESMSDVEDGEYEVLEVGTVVIKDNRIEEIKPVEEEVVEEVVEDAPVAFDAEASYKEMVEMIEALKALIEGLKPSEEKEEVDVEAKLAEMKANFEDQIKAIPAMSAEGVKQNFSDNKKVSTGIYTSNRKG